MKTFGKAFRLGFNNTALAVNSILMQVVVFALVAAVLALAVFPVFTAVVDIIEEFEISQSVTELVEMVTQGEFENEKVAQAVTAIIDKVLQALDSAQDSFKSLTWAYIAILLLIVLFRFTQSLVDVPVAQSLNEFMLTCNNRHYLWYFIKKIGRSAEFSFVQLTVALFLDLLTVCGTIGLYIIILAPMGIAGFILALLSFVFIYSLRFALTGFWLAEYVSNGYKIFQALKNSIKKALDRFWQMLSQIFIVMIASFALCGLLYYAANSVHSSWQWVIAVSSSIISYIGFYIVKCIAFVQFFEQDGKQYYTKRRHFDEKTDNSFIIVE